MSCSKITPRALLVWTGEAVLRGSPFYDNEEEVMAVRDCLRIQ
jgi:hypothetical protein